jgi:beta-N-acetylhexosaminidase
MQFMGGKKSNMQSNRKRAGANHILAFPTWVFHTLFLISLLLFSVHISANSALINAQIPLQNQFKNVDIGLRAKIAQKMFIDLRFYCAPKVDGHCQQALLELPDELAAMLSKSKVGGVILFSENLFSAEQIVRLIHHMQTSLKPAQQKAKQPDSVVDNISNHIDPQHLYVPLYIGIDQEGGRVSRLPQSEFIGFAGNMAIGATAKTYNKHFSDATSFAIANHLNLLGINVNFAPVLDVNSNPNNPIINVRSYGQLPTLVSNLGGASIQMMQQQNVSVAAKHFPGHGDTFVDSHVGLPSVNHDREMINRIDLLPFRNVISNPKTRPDMIMTAHIQYPALDDTRFVGDKALTTIVPSAEVQMPVLPATLSKEILTGILREELAYDGIIITDALNMRAITQYLSPTEAVIQSFRAGADITLMPYHISSPEDAIGFLDWLNELTIFISQDNDLRALVDASYKRIIAHKAKRNIAKRTLIPLADKLAMVANTAYKADDNKLALALSAASFTQIKGLTNPILPNQRLLVLMPDKLRCQAFEQYWVQQKDAGAIVCISTFSQAIPENVASLAHIDAVLVGDASPQLAFRESNKYEGIHFNERIDNGKQQTALYALIKQAEAKGIPRVLVKLRSPYISVDDATLFSGIFASFDYQVVSPSAAGKLDPMNNISLNDLGAGVRDEALSQRSEKLNDKAKDVFSPAFFTLVRVITGIQEAQGNLPVTLLPEVLEALPMPEVKKKRVIQQHLKNH